jgi:hypothetical protein
VVISSTEANSGERWLADPIERRLDVLRGELGSVVEQHVLAQVEGVGLAVLGDLPAMRQVGNDGLARIARIAPHQVVVHATLAAQVVDRARLVKVEVRRSHGDGVFHHAAAFGIGLRRGELEFRAVELVGHALGECLPGHAEHRCRGGGRSLDELTTIYARTLLTLVHGIASHLVFCRPRTMCCDGLSIIMDQK